MKGTSRQGWPAAVLGSLGHSGTWKEVPARETRPLPWAFAVPVPLFICKALKFRNLSGLPVGEPVYSKWRGLAPAVASPSGGPPQATNHPCQSRDRQQAGPSRGLPRLLGHSST